MNIVKSERSFEPCSESGWFGYNVYLDRPADESFAYELSALGETIFMRKLKKPFLIVRTDKFLVRCVLGNSFIKIGIARNDTKLLETVLDAIRKIPC